MKIVTIVREFGSGDRKLENCLTEVWERVLLKQGKKETPHLCVNTSDVNIKSIVPPIAEIIKKWFENHEK